MENMDKYERKGGMGRQTWRADIKTDMEERHVGLDRRNINDRYGGQTDRHWRLGKTWRTGMEDRHGGNGNHEGSHGEYTWRTGKQM